MATLYDQKITDQQITALKQQGSVIPTLSLTYNERQRNRLAVMLSNGQAAAIVLPRGQFLQSGDVLTGADGAYLRIQAKPEPLLCACASSGLDLMRLVYHLANRHVRAMLTPEAVYIEPDPVLADLMKQLGATVQTVSDVFEPEAGAYAGGHHHHHSGHDKAGDSDTGSDTDSDTDSDVTMGRVGEMLSMAAHQDKRHATLK